MSWESVSIFCGEIPLWPLVFLLVALFVLKQVKEEVNPIVRNVVGSLAIQSQKNAIAWAIGMMLGTVASLQAVVEVSQQMHWPYVGALAKVLQPGLAAVIGYVTKSPTQQKETTPPFPHP